MKLKMDFSTYYKFPLILLNVRLKLLVKKGLKEDLIVIILPPIEALMTHLLTAQFDSKLKKRN